MKKTVLIGAAGFLAVGFFTLTAFGGGKTKAEQQAEIASAITAKVESLRAEKATECDARIAAEAKSRFDAMAAATPEPTPEPVKPGKKPVKKGNKGGPKIDPLPQPAPPPANKTDAKVESRLPGQAKPTTPAETQKKVDEKVKSRLPGKPAGGGGK